MQYNTCTNRTNKEPSQSILINKTSALNNLASCRPYNLTYFFGHYHSPSDEAVRENVCNRFNSFAFLKMVAGSIFKQ